MRTTHTPRPLANQASLLAITALVDLTVGALGTPKPKAIAVPDLILLDPSASISCAFLFFCRLIFRLFFEAQK